jgi:aspartyl-tRNA(Asn)/glutamyl-tRNA(Gln) amidotransferase subunit A
VNPTILKPYRELLRCLKKRGAEIVPVSLPSTRYALSAYYVIASAEASSNLARYDGIEYGMIELSAYILARILTKVRFTR